MPYAFTRRVAGVDTQKAQDINDLQTAVEQIGNVDLPDHADNVASGTALGHVKVGTGLTIDAGGVLNASGGASALNDLTDVTITTPANTQVLTYNGTGWVNAAAAAAPTVEDWHEVGAAGEPAFQNAWVNFNPPTDATAAFYKDPFGVVHIKGFIKSGSIGDGVAFAVFTLPAGYRPPLREFFNPPSSPSGTGSRVDVYPTGELVIVSGSASWQSISGIMFRAV